MKARALPHRPASNRPARRWLTLSLFACVRVTRLRPSFSWAIPRVAVRSPSTKRFCSGLGGGGGAGEAPRLLAYDDATGCPLDQALAALEWTAAVGILSEDDLIHAARLGADAAAALVERKEGDQRVFIYFGPRMDAPPADPYEGTL